MKTQPKKTVNQLLLELRKERRMSQMKLAEMVGVSYQQIQKYEKGVNSISIERLRQIAKALDAPLKDFFPSEKWTVSEETASYGKMTDEEQLVLHLFRGIKDKKLKKSIIEFLKSLSK
jgi:transcriptional regulator with XRE-family HTH domain